VPVDAVDFRCVIGKSFWSAYFLPRAVRQSLTLHHNSVYDLPWRLVVVPRYRLSRFDWRVSLWVVLPSFTQGAPVFNHLTPTVAIGYSYKHLVSDLTKPSFVIFDIRALGTKRQHSDCLTRSGTGCFIAVSSDNSGRQRVNVLKHPTH